MVYLKIILLAIIFIWTAEAKDCVPRNFNNGSIVCVCNATHCDTIPEVEVPEKGKFNWYVSSKDGLRMSFSQGKFSDGPQNHSRFVENIDNLVDDYVNMAVHKITVNREKTYQMMWGFGGAFTDATGINIRSLSNKTQEFLMQSYFGKEGSRYNMGRVPIGATDFSTKFYSYDNVLNDFSLQHFQLAKEDFELKIPYIHWAKKLAPDLKLTAAVWSPPVWMKTNNNSYGPSVLKTKYYQVYADYIVRFLREYKSHGVEIWAVSTGNEPISSFVPNFKLPAMGWLAFELGVWIANNLGPSIVNSEFNETYILVFDDQRFLLTWYADLTFSNKAALDVIDGLAVHWYLDTIIAPEVLDSANQRYPNKFIIMTEACIGFRPNEQPKVRLGHWESAQEYVMDMIENFRHWVTGWLDWNLALDKIGGPSWIQNYVDAPIIVNAKADEFYKQPSYYMIAHFSRFVKRDSIRVDSTETNKVKSVAFETPSKTIVLVLYNLNTKESDVIITDSKSGSIKLNLAPQSVHTIEYK